MPEGDRVRLSCSRQRKTGLPLVLFDGANFHNCSGFFSPPYPVLRLSNVTTEAAAEASGISSRTMRRYMQDPAFARAYRDGRRAMLEERVSALQQASQAALETLRTALDDEDANVRVRAARAIFDYAYKGLEVERSLRETEELAAEVEELKRALL